MLIVKIVIHAFKMVRDTRIELVSLAWEANILPLYESRTWSRWAGSNRRPLLYESIALPTELHRRKTI